MPKIKLIYIAIIVCLFSSIIYGQDKQFMYDGIERTYTVYEPSLDPNPGGYPLVIGLHGTGSNGKQFIATAFLIQKAVKEKFILACPDALNYNLFTYFNAGDGYTELTGGTDDVGFISALIDTMVKNYNVDTSRIYVTGFSNGSCMSYRVAAELSFKIAAVGAVSGQMVYEYCDPEFPVPIIHFHGLSDNLLPYEGKGDSILVFPPVDSAMAIWRGINNCDSIAETIYNEPGIIGKKWASLDANADVILYTIQDQEHEWPRPASLGISATDVIWDFLKLYTREGGTAIEKEKSQSVPENFTLYQNYPNPFNPVTSITYHLPASAQVSLAVYNMSGQKVKTLVEKFQKRGRYSVTWDASGKSSGIYFYQMTADGHIFVNRCLLLR